MRRSSLVSALSALSALSVGLLACDTGGGSGPPATNTPGSESSAFDDFFNASAGPRQANDSSGAAACAADDPGCDTSTDPGSPSNPSGPGQIDLPECSAPLSMPAGATGTCTPFCQKVAECRGDDSLVAACVSDCADSLRGMETAAVAQIFGCFIDADCEALNAWGQGGVSESTPAPEPVPAREGEGADAGDVPDRGDEGDYSDPTQPITDCVDGLLERWSTQTLPAAKQAICDATTGPDAACEDSGSGTSTEGSTGSASSGEASANASDSGASAGDAGAAGDDDGSASTPTPDEDPADPIDPPPEPVDGQATDDGGSDTSECTAIAGMLTQTVLDRIATCFALDDCDARRTCIDEQLACVPFLRSILFGLGGPSGEETTVDVSAPPEAADSDSGAAPER